MGFTTQFESHTVEFPLIYKLEHDDDALEFYCQPSTFEISYVSASGRLMRHPHTPDYFVIRRNSAGWIEAKDQEMLPALSKAQPNRYRMVDGVWTCPPGQLFAEKIGLTYSVHSSVDVRPVFSRNANFMDDYLRNPPAVHKAAKEAILEHLGWTPVTTLADLVSGTSESASRDDIYTLICDRTIHVDWNAHPFAEPEEVRLFASADTAEAFALATSPNPPERGILQIQVGSRLAWDGRFWTVANSGDNLIALSGEGVDFTELSINKFEELLTAGRISQTRDPITIPESAYACWSQFKTKREDDGLPAPSFNTYLMAIENRPRDEQARKRDGHRAAYKHEEFVWYLERSTPRHGDRPFEIAHIDHTQLDIELKCLKTGENLKRPWLTIMTDACTRKFLAFYLTFDPPSYRSCMMVMRDCGRRHGRLPQIIVVDGGKEFQSIYFDHLLAYYECTKKVRPAAKARFGSECERLFGTTTSQLIHNLAGNTQATKNIRTVTKSNDPKALAVWDFAGLFERLESYMFDTYEILEHPALLQTPRDAFAHGMIVGGARLHRRVTFDRNFLINTSPSTRKGHAIIDSQRGVLVNGFRYWSDAFRGPGMNKKSVPVRFDPFDMGIAWVFVRGSWVECRNQYYIQMKGKTLKQVQIATALYLRKQKLSGTRRRSMTPRIIAVMLNGAQRDEEIRRQQLLDLESQRSRIHLVPRTKESDSRTALVNDIAMGKKPGRGGSAVATRCMADYETETKTVVSSICLGCGCCDEEAIL